MTDEVEVKSKRSPRRKMTMTELALLKLSCPKQGQDLIWDTGDEGQRGLSVMLNSGGCKTYRSTYTG